MGYKLQDYDYSPRLGAYPRERYDPYSDNYLAIFAAYCIVVPHCVLMAGWCLLAEATARCWADQHRRKVLVSSCVGLAALAGLAALLFVKHGAR